MSTVLARGAGGPAAVRAAPPAAPAPPAAAPPAPRAGWKGSDVLDGLRWALLFCACPDVADDAGSVTSR